MSAHAPPEYDDAGNYDENGNRIGRAPLALLVKNRSQLKHLPKPEPLIENTLDTRTVAVLGGYWGTCKSFIALSWCLSVATGTRWLGRPAMRRRVLYLITEGAYSLDERVSAWETAWKRTVEDTYMDTVDVPVNLGNSADVAELCHLARAGGYGLLTIDTLAKCMLGLDENGAKDTGRVIDSLYRLCGEMSEQAGTVAAVHHTGKDKVTMRGSSAIESGVDTVYLTEGDPRHLLLHREKRKDGPKEDRLTLRLAPVPGTGSCVMEVHGGVGQGTAEEKVLSHFLSHFSATGATSTMLKDTLPDLPKSSLFRAVNALVNRGVLVNTGTPQRPFYVLAGEAHD